MARGLRAGRRIDEPLFPIDGWVPPSNVATFPAAFTPTLAGKLKEE